MIDLFNGKHVQKISFFNRPQKATSKKKQKVKKQTTTKILVRNIPFEAKKQEVYELFKYLIHMHIFVIMLL